ncbi:MAG: efflux RND transporter permease subunit, partial [Myxococcota bacterium]
RRFGLAALLLCSVVLVAVFRSLRLAALPLIVVAISALWTLGVMAFFDFQLTILSVCLVSLVLTVGVADSIHVLTAYRQRLTQGTERDDALRSSLDELMWPCFLTSITTAAGMLSLQASTLQPVREFGWMAALGVVLAFALSVTLIPALLSWLPGTALPTRSKKPDRLDRVLDAVARSSGHGSRFVLVSSGLLVVAALSLLPGLEMGSNPLGYFKPDAPIRRATEAIDRALGGSASIEFLVEADGGGLREPDTLQHLEVLEASLLARPGISQVTSVLAPLRELRRVLQGEAPGTGALPENRELAAQLHLLLEGALDYPQLVQDDASVGRVSARARYTHAGDLVASLPALEAELAQLGASGGPTVKPTGPVKLIANMETQLLRSQVRSFLAAFAVITLLMFAVTRSLSLGLLAMIPNLVPVILGLGFMAALNFSLDPGTVMIASIALGLVVDDTVHFIVRFQRQRASGTTTEAAVAHTVRTAGRPIILTSLVLLGGFGVLAFSSFNPNVHFGLISAVVVV